MHERDCGIIFGRSFVAGLVIGLAAGLVGVPPKAASAARAVALALSRHVAAALLWHGPLGAADRFAREAERNARIGLDQCEMPLSARTFIAGR